MIEFIVCVAGSAFLFVIFCLYCDYSGGKKAHDCHISYRAYKTLRDIAPDKWKRREDWKILYYPFGKNDEKEVICVGMKNYFEYLKYIIGTKIDEKKKAEKTLLETKKKYVKFWQRDVDIYTAELTLPSYLKKENNHDEM